MVRYPKFQSDKIHCSSNTPSEHTFPSNKVIINSHTQQTKTPSMNVIRPLYIASPRSFSQSRCCNRWSHPPQHCSSEIPQQNRTQNQKRRPGRARSCLEIQAPPHDTHAGSSIEDPWAPAKRHEQREKVLAFPLCSKELLLLSRSRIQYAE